MTDTTTTDLSGRRVALVGNTSFYLGPPLARELARRGHDLVIGDPEEGLVDELEENDDVQGVYANFDISEEILEAVAG